MFFWCKKIVGFLGRAFKGCRTFFWCFLKFKSLEAGVSLGDHEIFHPCKKKKYYFLLFDISRVSL